MAISEAAERNHEELFPNRKSTLKITDPELIKVFDNFAFDEVVAESTFDTLSCLSEVAPEPSAPLRDRESTHLKDP